MRGTIEQIVERLVDNGSINVDAVDCGMKIYSAPKGYCLILDDVHYDIDTIIVHIAVESDGRHFIFFGDWEDECTPNHEYSIRLCSIQTIM